MKKRKHYGFTIIEIVISFVLVSFVAISVGFVTTSSYNMSSKLSELQNKYYSAQNEVETEIQDLSDLLKAKYTLENEMRNDPEAANNPDNQEKLEALDDLLSAYQKREITLFDKEVYTYNKKYDPQDDDDNNINFNFGGVNFVSINNPVPIIDKVSLSIEGESSNQDYSFNSVGKKIYAHPSYNLKNISHRNTETYRWYICQQNDEKIPDYHTAPYVEGYNYINSKNSNTIYSVFPNNFSLLPIPTHLDYMKVKEEYLGKFIVCVVTPIGDDGSMGEPKVSNYMYLSAMPTKFSLDFVGSQIITDRVTAVIDPSLLQIHYNRDGEESIDLITANNLISNGELVSYDSAHHPKLSLIGSQTSTKPLPSEMDRGYTRYISFDENTSLHSNNIKFGKFHRIYAVVRVRDDSEPNFIFSGGVGQILDGKSGFGNNCEEGCQVKKNEWQVIQMKSPILSDNSFEIGKCNIDLAELIIADTNMGWNADFSEQIVNYLKAKYKID